MPHFLQNIGKKKYLYARRAASKEGSHLKTYLGGEKKQKVIFLLSIQSVQTQATNTDRNMY